MRGERFDWVKHRRLLEGKKTNKEVAAIIGCTVQSVRNQRHKMGDYRTPNRKLIDWSKYEHIVTDASIPTSRAAEIIGCAYGTLEYRRRKLGVDVHVNGVQDRRRFNYRQWVADMMDGIRKPLHEYHEMILSADQLARLDMMEVRDAVE